MKRLAYTIILTTAILAITSCEKQESYKDGDWEAIQIDKTAIEFPKEGGKAAVTRSNYSRWWISTAYQSAKWSGNHWDYQEPIGQITYSVDGSWYDANVSDEGKSSILEITVDPNDTNAERRGLIVMTVGDSFISITIQQQ